MTPPAANDSTDTSAASETGVFFTLRAALGGLLMGLANLVPGVSGGTMLLATGVYPTFINAVAEITTLRFRRRSVIALGVIAATAAAAILLLAGPTKDVVVSHRWIMYSLFIGLTLGGVPLVWRLARPASPGMFAGAGVAFVLMVLMAFAGTPAEGGDNPRYLLLFLSGLAGASAMILPGISGGYLLLLLGQYVPILTAIDNLKQGLRGSDMDLVLEAMKVAIPVGIGVVAGVVGVSNLLRWLLRRHRNATLGALLGLLLGAVVGLWPFQEGVAPVPGDTLKGTVVTVENLAEFEPDDWEVRRFSPTGAQAGASAGLIVAGFLATILINRMGGKRSREI